MVAWLMGLVGLVVGGVLAGAIVGRRLAAQRNETMAALESLATARESLAGREAELAALRVSAEEAEARFEGLSHRVLTGALEHLTSIQGQVQAEREARLDASLAPLRSLLEEYQRSLAAFDKEHAGALAQVTHGAQALLDAQQRAQAETARLSQLLGRSSQRGRWGEAQLANVLSASGLSEGIDYRLQVTAEGEGGLRRPDCVVTLPDAQLAIDAKFPFDRFEAALDAPDEETRTALYREHARALRGHVKTLRDRAYWEVLDPSPAFVVCFVPSDAALAEALAADPSLHADAADGRVLLCGPTTLLALLWSVHFVLRQHRVALNAERILEVASELHGRIRAVAEPVVTMGRSLGSSVAAYNQLVGSLESRLLPAARRAEALGLSVAHALPDLAEATTLPRGIDPARWGLDALPAREDDERD